MDYIIIKNDEFLEHHGILGQKWGVRRYQNKDGSLTNLGKKRASVHDSFNSAIENHINKKYDKRLNSAETDFQRSNVKSQKEEALKKHEEQVKWKKERRDYVDDESIANKAVKLLLFGPFGAYTYNSSRVAGNERAKSAAIAITTNILGGALGNAFVSSMIADDYKKKQYN